MTHYPLKKHPDGILEWGGSRLRWSHDRDNDLQSHVLPPFQHLHLLLLLIPFHPRSLAHNVQLCAPWACGPLRSCQGLLTLVASVEALMAGLHGKPHWRLLCCPPPSLGWLGTSLVLQCHDDDLL